MDFENKAPKWDAEGTEPSSDLQTKGFQAGYKPPAPYFNWLFNKISKCISELQTKLSTTHTKAENLERTHVLTTFTNLSDVGQTLGSETIEGIATNMPNNSILSINITSTNNTAIYPFTYGVLNVLKKDNSRVLFEFWYKSFASKYIGFYDETTATKWTGWALLADTKSTVEAAKKDGSGNVIKDTYATVTALTSHTDSENNPHNVTKAQVGLDNVDNTSDKNKPVSTAQQEAIDAVQKNLDTAQETNNAHISNNENPHNVTKAQVGLSNVPNVKTNDQTPTYSDTSTLATLKSGEKLNVAFQKIKLAITTLINHIGNKENPHGVTVAQIGAAAATDNAVCDYVDIAKCGQEVGSETIEGIATGLPNNSRLFLSVGTTHNTAIYPQQYGVCIVTKKDSSRVVFEFYMKTDVCKYIGIYDGTKDVKWTGWQAVLTRNDVVNNLTSTATNLPLSAKQGNALNARVATLESNKANGGSVDLSSYTLAQIVEFVGTQTGRVYVGRFKLAADHSPTGTNTWFRGVMSSQNVANDTNDVSVNILALAGDNVTYTGNIYGLTTFTMRWSVLLRKDDVVNNLTSTVTNVPLSAKQGKVLNDSLNEHTSDKENPHSVTKSQVGLGNVPNVSTNDQTPTYSDTSTLATLKSGEKLNVALQKIKLAITTLINHVNNKSNPHSVTTTQIGAAVAAQHALKTYVAFSDAGQTIGSETIEGIANGLPENSILCTNITSTNNVDIYPQTYGVLNVIKKDTSRVMFEFFVKSTGAKWVGFYDSTASTKWTGWDKVLIQDDVVDNLLSTATNLPVSANQARLLSERDNTQQNYIDSCLNNMSGLSSKTNLLEVNLNTPTASVNKVSKVNTSDASTLENSPVTSGIFFAKWECIYFATNRVLVKVTEFYPNYGRVWHNHYNNSSWSGWKLVGGCTIGAGTQGFTTTTGTGNNSFLRQDQSTGFTQLHVELTGMDTTKSGVNVAFANVSANYRPNKAITVMGMCWDTATNAYTPVKIRINTNGNICQVQSSSLKIEDIYFDAFWYTNFSNYEVLA